MHTSGFYGSQMLEFWQSFKHRLLRNCHSERNFTDISLHGFLSDSSILWFSVINFSFHVNQYLKQCIKCFPSFKYLVAMATQNLHRSLQCKGHWKRTIKRIFLWNMVEPGSTVSKIMFVMICQFLRVSEKWLVTFMSKMLRRLKSTLQYCPSCYLTK